MTSRRWMCGRARRDILGIGNFSSGNYYATLNDGGEAGVSSGFGSVGIITLEALGISRYLFSHAAGSGSPGHMFWINSSDQIVFLCGNSTPAVVSSPAVQLRGSDVGKLLIILGWHTGSQLRCAVSTILTGQTGTAITGYTPFTGAPSVISGYASPPGSSSPAVSMRYHSHLTFRGTPTDAQLQALIDAARAVDFGSLPSSFAGATVTHRCSVRDVLSGTAPVDGQSAPGTLPDTITGASIDTMTRSGSGTVVRKTDSRIDGRKTYGAINVGDYNYLATAQGANTGIVGSASTGVYVQAYVKLGSVSSLTTYCSRSSGNSNGYYLEEFGGNLRFRAGNGSTLITSPVVSKTALSNRYGLITGIWDPVALTLRFNFDGVEQASPTAMTAYLPATGATTVMYVGRSNGGGDSAGDSVNMGVSGGDFAPTAAQLLAQAEACRLAGKLIPLAGSHSYDITQDVAANGGPLLGFPAVVRDRIGSHDLTRFGGLQVVNGGLTGFGASGYPQGISVADGLPGLASAMWCEALIVAPPSGISQSIFSNTGGSANGLNYFVGGDNRVWCNWGDGSATYSTATGALTPGQTYHALAYYDGSRGYACLNGAQIAATVSTFTLMPGSLPTKLGTLFAGTSQPSVSMVIRGVSGGHVVPTPAEISAASAYALANGRVGGVPGGGRTLRLYDLVQDVIDAGGKAPVVVKDRISGSAHLPIIGTGLQVGQRAERVYGWEAA